MTLVWTPIATAMMVASSVATFFTMLHLRRHWDVHVASVRWIFWLFFVYLWLWCLLRSVYLVWVCVIPRWHFVKHTAPGHAWTHAEADGLGIYATVHLREVQTVWVSIVFCLGDVALLGVALTVFPLSHELWRLASRSMDRGGHKERAQIRRYTYGIHGPLLLFAAAELVLGITYGGYNVITLRCLLGVFVVQFLGLVVMLLQLLRLKCKGRQYETVHGAFVASPAYQRLKRIMLVYAVFAFQFQLASLVVYLHGPTKERTVEYIGLSQVLYNASGLALSITTSCSQTCVFRTISCCLPHELEVEFVRRRLAGVLIEVPNVEDCEAPLNNPVFVFTDIESSSALWAIEDGHLMTRATAIHDNILRSTVPTHHGYEITTCGDSFQLAFRCIRDAIEYCLDVQLQLLIAKWPRELHGAVVATRRRRAGRRLIFNGLRVRMGVHDAAECEGVIIRDTHAVTGKVLYSGTSEAIGAFVGDLGSGGQILVTKRVANWTHAHADSMSTDLILDRVGLYTVPHVDVVLEVFQVTPTILGSRCKHFITPETGQALLEHRPRHPRSVFQNDTPSGGAVSSPTSSFVVIKSPC